MHTTSSLASCQSGLSLLAKTWALPAILALSALAVPAVRADVIFTRSTVTGEGWAPYSATFTPAYSGNYTLGFNITAGGPSNDNAILIDAVRVSSGPATTLFSDGFETPDLPNDGPSYHNTGLGTGNWVCTDFSGLLDGSPPNWGLAGQGLGFADGTRQYAFLQAYTTYRPSIKSANTIALVAGQTYTVSFYQASRRDFGGTTTYTVTLDAPPPVTVFASGISPVIAWDPIYPAAAISPWQAESKPVPTVGYNANWVNPHPASVFPVGSHPWEFIAPMDFAANWINAWSNITSQGPAGQSWTKYSTTVTGEGDFVLQFLADNASWIYIDGQLVGFQDQDWTHNSTGRYTIHLTGAGPHELSFIIWDGGGAAGGKFRLETVQSFQENNPGEVLPPPPPPSDTTAPVITAPADITTEATGPSGAIVSYPVTAMDDVDGPVPVEAIPPSGSMFALGATPVGLGASDAAGNMAYAQFSVTVQDTTPPVITPPANIVAEATGAAGATVSFVVPDAADLVSGNVTVGASPASGSTFALGATMVALSAADAAGNAAAASFSVTVQDTTPPAITPPANIVAEATSAAGAAVSFTVPDAADLVTGSVTVGAAPASGSTFALGTTTVALNTTDTVGNAATASFSVTVRDTTAPVITPPANIVAEATSAAGASVAFAVAPALDLVSGSVPVTVAPGSGSTFALGSTTVALNTVDAAGNAAAAAFSVTVRDTTAPVITPPADIVVEATSPAGAAVTFSASATDAVGVAALTYSIPSGSTFALGTTTVALGAVDAAGNAATASFTVTVVDTTAPVIQSLTATPGVLWPPNHKLVGVTLTALVSDVADPAPLTRIVSVSSLELPKSSKNDDCDDDDEHDAKIRHSRNDPDWVITGDLTLQLRAERAGNGGGRVYTITVESKDAAGNVSTGTVTVTVPKNQGNGHDNHKGDKDDDKKGGKKGDKDDGKKDRKDEGKKDGKRG